MSIMISNPKLLQTLSFIALFLMLANKLVHSQDVTSFAFDSFDLTYQGDARVLSGSRILSLAETEPSGEAKKESVGRVLISKPIKFWESSLARQASFETTISFLIKPSSNGAAEGIAFFIAPVNTTILNGTTGGNLGIYNIPNIFAVEFDTNFNVWDPTYNHVGINVESRVSRNATRFNAGTGEVVTTRINYNPITKIISVIATSASETAELSYAFDLMTVLHEEGQVGITSSTGFYISAVGIPDIVSWLTSFLVNTSVNRKDTYIHSRVCTSVATYVCVLLIKLKDVNASLLLVLL
ncbi:hypothetical protein ACS0TY_022343 [Phlomoides rotata]